MNKKLFAPLALVWLITLTLLAPNLRAQGFGTGQGYGGGTGVFTVKNINVGTPNTPQYTTLAGEEKRYDIKKWLEIEVEFSSSAPVTPEVTLKYYVLLGGTLLTGEVTHVDVPAGQSLFSVMYIAPRTLATMLKGAPLSNATVQNIAVQIVKPGVSQPLAEKQLKGGPPFYTTLQQVPGLVLNKSQTPFAFLYWDRYEVIKNNRPTGGG